MKKTILTTILALFLVLCQNLNAHQTNEVKVILTFQAKAETKKEFLGFLEENVPNVRAFEGCSRVNVYFNNTSNEMIITENWKSKQHHRKYIKAISENGIMKELISYLDKEPTIKYYKILDI